MNPERGQVFTRRAPRYDLTDLPATSSGPARAVSRSHDLGTCMRVDRSVLQDLEFSRTAENVCRGALQRFPPLTMYHCMANDLDTLVSQTVTGFEAGRAVRTETISIPRKGFGPRPVAMLALPDRVFYESIVTAIASAADIEGRTEERWKEFFQFGEPKTADATPRYLVEIDIASCYEYIDHATLQAELLMRCENVPQVSALVEFLGEALGGQGIPQLSDASDLLAEGYLERIERDLLRAGHSAMRVADDFKVETDEWGTALDVVDEAAESARRLNLVLSSEKTNITKKETIYHRRVELSKFISRYFDEAADELRVRTFGLGDYLVEPVTIEPSEQESGVAAYQAILREWAEAPAQRPLHAQGILPAIANLSNVDDRLSDDLLGDIVFHFPLYLEQVCLYLLGRPSDPPGLGWTSLRHLVDMSRQSQWAKLWLMFFSARLPQVETEDRSAVGQWLKAQLESPSEVVRGQAAWALSTTRGLSPDDAGRLYSTASERPGPRSPLRAGGPCSQAPIQWSKLFATTPRSLDALSNGASGALRISRHNTRLAELAVGNVKELARSADGNESRLPYVVIGACTQAEIYVDRVLSALIEASSAKTVPFGQMLIANYGSDYQKTWSARHACLSRGFAIHVQGSPEGQRMGTLIELRNALAHGDGQLTEMQSHKLNKQLELERAMLRDLDVSVIARRMIYGTQTRARVSTVSTDFVLSVDHAFRVNYPGVLPSVNA